MIKKSRLFLLVSVFILSLSSCTFTLTGSTESSSKSSESISSEETSDTEPGLEEDTTEDSTSSSESTSEGTSTSTSEDTSEDSSTSSSDSTSEDTGEDGNTSSSDSTSEDTGEDPNTSENTSEDDTSSDTTETPGEEGDTTSDTDSGTKPGDSSSSSKEDDDTDLDPYPTYQAYSYVVDSSDFNKNGGSFTNNGLTWTYDSATGLNKDSSGRGIQIGTSNSPQYDPWTISTDFGELVQLNSVTAYIFTSTSSGLTAHYEITFDSESIDSGDYHSSSSSDVTYAGKTGLTYEGSKLTLSINAVNATAFYLQAIVLSVHTAKDSKLSLSTAEGYLPSDYQDGGDTGSDTGDTGGDTPTPNPSDDSEYTRYQSFAHKWSTDDIKVSGGSVTVGGLTWYYSDATFIGKDGQFDRGVQIGSSNSPQQEPWTIYVDFGEDVELTNISVQLFTTTSGSASYSIYFPSSSCLGSGDYNTPSTDMEYAYSAEYSDIALIGDSLLISLWTSAKNAFYLRSITFDIYTTEDSNLELVAEDLEDPEYDPQPVEPGVNNVKATKYAPIDDSWESYYSTWDLTLQGDALREEIQEKNVIQTAYTYDDVRYMFPYSDEDPDNPGYMLGCYDGDKIPAYWDSARTDREHVWPCAHMKIVVDESGDYRPSGSSVGHYSDLHNLRVSCKPVNNYKSDKYFDTYNDSNFFFPNVTNPESLGSGTQHKYDEGNRESDNRGDVARICLYMYAMYEELDLVDDFTNVNEDLTFGRLSTLLEWNEEDPVDEFETQRNNRIYEYQGNRNPFIDYPSLANSLFA